MTNHLNNQDILTQIRKLFPYDNTMCKEKYNETIQDYLYEEIREQRVVLEGPFKFLQQEYGMGG